MAIEILQNALERFGVITVMDVTLYDRTSLKPLMFLDTLKMSNITSEGQQKEIKGGKFADRLLVYNYARTATVDFQDALLSFPTMGALWGAELTKNDGTIIEHKVFSASSATTLTLPDNAVSIEGVVRNDVNTANDKYLVLGGATPAAGEYYWTKTTANQVKLNAADTGTITVYYTALVAVNASASQWDSIQALIKSSSFPKTVKFVGKTIFIEEETGRQVEAEIEIPKLKLSANFTLTMETEGDASVFDFTGMALASETGTSTGELVKIKTIRYLD